MNFEIGSIYSFRTIAPEVLGEYFEDMKLKAIATFDIVMALNYNAVLKHKQVYNSDNYDPTYKSADTYQYLIFETKNGDTVILGEPWIISSSINSEYGIDVSLSFNNISLDDIELIGSQLTSLGYPDIKIKMDSVN